MANAGIPNTTREELFERERGVDPGVRLWDGSRVRSLLMLRSTLHVETARSQE
jgi:hypothetical protein